MHGEPSCSDWKRSYQNIQDFIVRPLRSSGAEVSVFIASYRDTNCRSRDQEMLNAYRPTAFRFDPDPYTSNTTSRRVDGYIRAIDLVRRFADNRTHGDSLPIDALVLLRFDVRYNVPITALPLDWRAVNLPFRDNVMQWQWCQQVSDLLFVLPMAYASHLTRALGTLLFIHMRISCCASIWMYQ